MANLLGGAANAVFGRDITPNGNFTFTNNGGIPFVGIEQNNRQGNIGNFNGDALRNLTSGARLQSNYTQPRTTANVDPSLAYQGGGTDFSTGGGTAGGKTQAQVDAEEMAATLYGIDTGLEQANSGLGRLDNQQRIGNENIDRDYTDSYQRLLGNQNRGKAQYDQNRTGQLNQYESARNMSATNARGFLDSTRRVLGAAGAGQGSAARFGAANEANQMLAGQNAQAQQINNRNITSLEQGRQRDEDEFANSYSDLSRQREQGRNDFTSGIEQQRAQLLSTVGQLTGQRNIAQGGDFNSARAAAQPYTSRISEILSRIDGLAATPAIRERQVTLSRPDLSEYRFARPEQAPQAQQDPTLSGISPVLAALLGQQQEEQLV